MNKDRLQEIRKWNIYNTSAISAERCEDIEWLISEVERLENVLKKIANHPSPMGTRRIAIEALETHEDRERQNLLDRANNIKHVPGHGPNLNTMSNEQLEKYVDVMDSIFEEAFKEEPKK